MAARPGVRETARLAGVDRKTVRRYVAAGEAAGLVANGDEAQLTEAAVGAVLLALRSGRPPGRGPGWSNWSASGRSCAFLIPRFTLRVRARAPQLRMGRR